MPFAKDAVSAVTPSTVLAIQLDVCCTPPMRNVIPKPWKSSRPFKQMVATVYGKNFICLSLIDFISAGK
jgi:hypothetical protein